MKTIFTFFLFIAVVTTSECKSLNNEYEFMSWWEAKNIADTDINKAMNILTYLAENDDANSQAELVSAYVGYKINNGYDSEVKVEKNYIKAFYWARKLSENSSIYTSYMTDIADFYYKGKLKTKSEKEKFEKAFYWYKKAVELDPEAAKVLGDMYFYGQGTKRDFSLAAKWYQYYDDNKRYWEYSAQSYAKRLHLYESILDYKLIKLFDEQGIKAFVKELKSIYDANKIPNHYNNGKFEYMYGLALEVESWNNNEAAQKLFNLASQKGSVKAWYEMGEYFVSTYGKFKNKEYGLKLMKYAAENGYGYSGRRCAIRLGTEDDESGAVKCARLGAENGDNIAILYLVNNLDNKNEKIEWLRKLKDNKYKNANDKLGKELHSLYYETKDLKYLKEAAWLGYAMNDYGAYFFKNKKYDKAIYWFKKDAKKNAREALYNLGLMSENGNGVLKDYQEAVRYYNKAILAGSTSAKCALSRLYVYGLGVDKNMKKAKKLSKMGYQGIFKKEACKKIWNKHKLYEVSD